MNPNLTKDQISMMNSILDRELNLLSGNQSLDTPAIEKENFETQKPRGLSTKDFASSGHSEKNFESSYKEPRDITNQNNPRKAREFPEPPQPSSKMQNDLLELQSKILSLEKTFGSLNAVNSPPHQNVSSSQYNTNSQKILEESRGKPLRDELNDSLEESPLRKKSTAKSPYRRTAGKHGLGESLKESTMSKDDSLLSHSYSPAHRKSSHVRRSSSQNSNRKYDKSALEQSIREAQSQLDQSKSSLRMRSSSRGRSSSNVKSRSASKKKTGAESPREPGNYQEITILNKKVMELKKKRDEERAALLTERNRNQEMTVQVDKLNSKMKKMQIDLEKFAKIDLDYQKLMESFEKSEYIRNQQKQLIANLHLEIDQLKQQNELYNTRQTEPEEIKKKKLSSSTNSTGTTKPKTKKKNLM